MEVFLIELSYTRPVSSRVGAYLSARGYQKKLRVSDRIESTSSTLSFVAEERGIKSNHLFYRILVSKPMKINKRIAHASRK